jgi:hypothetical protein
MNLTPKELFACGSMVLCPYCMSFFRPAGRKNDIQGIEHRRRAKVLTINVPPVISGKEKPWYNRRTITTCLL